MLCGTGSCVAQVEVVTYEAATVGTHKLQQHAHTNCNSRHPQTYLRTRSSSVGSLTYSVKRRMLLTLCRQSGRQGASLTAPLCGTYVCMCVCMYVYKHIHACIRAACASLAAPLWYICMCVCMYVYKHIHACIRAACASLTAPLSQVHMYILNI
jgi:hypothetical protein